MKYLLDTNIFLEILLNQERAGECKKFITDNENVICISDFALHSIGVILFRNNHQKVYSSFLENFISELYILTLDKNSYYEIAKISEEYKLDFDDSYQLTVASEFNLSLITLDKDFNKLKNKYKIINLN